MTLKTMKTSKYVLSTVLKIIIVCEYYQALISNAIKLMQYDNNNQKVKYDYLKKLSILNI